MTKFAKRYRYNFFIVPYYLICSPGVSTIRVCRPFDWQSKNCQKCTKFRKENFSSLHSVLVNISNLFARRQHNMLVYHLMSFLSILSINKRNLQTDHYFVEVNVLNPFARWQHHIRLTTGIFAQNAHSLVASISNLVTHKV